MGGDGKDGDTARGRPKPNPGDAAPAGTPGTGENVCRDCGGTGRVDAQPCKTCGGTGRVIEGISGA